MRKEDRIRQQQSQQEKPAEEQQPPRKQEKMQGNAGMDQPSHPPRPGGKMPLPD